MIIQCDKCQTKFKLDDSKVTPQGVKVKCKKCANIFMVFPEKREEEIKIEFPEEKLSFKPEKEPAKEIKKEEITGESFELPSFEFTFEKKGEERTEKPAVTEEKQEFSWEQFSIDLGESPKETPA